MAEYCAYHGYPDKDCPYCVIDKAIAIQSEAKDEVVAEVLQLIDSGYDGPFMGDAVETLFKAANKLRKQQYVQRLGEAARKKWLKNR